MLVIDVETTGLKWRYEHIVEITVGNLDLSNGNSSIIYESLCNPQISVPRLERSWIVKKGYILVEEILKAPPIEEVVSNVKGIVVDGNWTAFNLKFEAGFLCNEPWNLPRSNLECPMLLSTPLCKIPHDYYGIKWPTLDEAFDILVKEEYDGRDHRARDDVIKTMKIILHLYENYGCYTISEKDV